MSYSLENVKIIIAIIAGNKLAVAERYNYSYNPYSVWGLKLIYTMRNGGTLSLLL